MVLWGRTTDVDGNEAIKIGGARKINVGKEAILGTDSSRKLNVGAAMIDVSLGTISSDGGIYTVNEARDILGFDPLPGGEVPLVYTQTGATPLATPAGRVGEA